MKIINKPLAKLTTADTLWRFSKPHKINKIVIDKTSILVYYGDSNKYLRRCAAEYCTVKA